MLCVGNCTCLDGSYRNIIIIIIIIVIIIILNLTHTHTHRTSKIQTCVSLGLMSGDQLSSDSMNAQRSRGDADMTNGACRLKHINGRIG